jgi:hypothetical protein
MPAGGRDFAAQMTALSARNFSNTNCIGTGQVETSCVKHQVGNVKFISQVRVTLTHTCTCAQTRTSSCVIFEVTDSCALTSVSAG